MASFRKRNNKWQVRIQRQDYPPIAKSFIELKTAKQWASQVDRCPEFQSTNLIVIILTYYIFGGFEKQNSDKNKKT